MAAWHVYQLRSDTELLYVGYSRWLKRRLGCHRREKPWWPEVTEVRSEEFATEDEARQREKELWVSDRPKHNRVSPFKTVEEDRTYARENVRQWKLAHPDRFRVYEQTRVATPEKYEARREYDRRYRRSYHAVPENLEAKRKSARESMRRLRAKRWQQPGPGLFDI